MGSSHQGFYLNAPFFKTGVIKPGELFNRVAEMIIRRKSHIVISNLAWKSIDIDKTPQSSMFIATYTVAYGGFIWYIPSFYRSFTGNLRDY